MVVAMAKDPRVLVIKLADRLHNMRTMRYLKREKQEKKARETLEIYAPLAHRLGMNTIKWELEDLAFAILYPKMYDEIVRLVAERAPKRDEYLAIVTDEVQADLRAARIKATVTGRPKHYYSVYQKMIVRGRDFAEIYDLVGIRVLVDTVRDCYAALGTVHARWNPVPGRFKDYIAMPKFNMYQSLHTTVIGPNGKPVELQIRTFDMHRRAEYGIAAHWKYKQEAVAGASKVRTDVPRTTGKDDDTVNDMAWLRQLLDWQKETEDPGEFLESLRFDLSRNEVFVFTPKGDVIALPAGATPVDFAYAVHTEVGHRTIGARVNGRLVPLESTLDNGDLVEVFTSKAAGAGPSRDWLGFVKSPRARNKIRAWFSKERRDEAIEQGKDAIARAMRKQNLPIQRILTGDSLVTLAHEMRYPDISVALRGDRRGPCRRAERRAEAGPGARRRGGGHRGHRRDASRPSRGRAKRRANADPGVVVKGVDDVWVKLARCCTPVPGDPIIGFVTRGSGVSVHRADCVNVDSLSQRARADPRGRVGAHPVLGLPGRHPGRGAGPVPAALGRHPGPVRPARQHPVGGRPDLPRPGRHLPLHLRDGRPEAPGPRPEGGTRRRGRLRRVPRDLGPQAVSTRPQARTRRRRGSRHAIVREPLARRGSGGVSRRTPAGPSAPGPAAPGGPPAPAASLSALALLPAARAASIWPRSLSTAAWS